MNVARLVWLIPLVMPVVSTGGCGSPVVNPGQTTTRVVAPPARPGSPSVPPPQERLDVPIAERSEIPQVPAESVMTLPRESSSARYHTVQPGETLSSIARRYGLTVEKLRTSNGLDATTVLQPQQLLFIPD
jgi:LysM repeat protein